jgi:hypothetical protein
MERTPRELLAPCLDDYDVLIGRLLEAITNPDELGENASKCMRDIIDQEIFLEACVGEAIEQMRRSERIEAMRRKNKEADARIAAITDELANFESKFYAAQQAKSLKNLEGQITTQRFAVDQLLVLSKRLASAALPERNVEPMLGPYPDERLMGLSTSRLRMSLKELEAVAANNGNLALFLAPPPQDFMLKAGCLAELAENEAARASGAAQAFTLRLPEVPTSYKVSLFYIVITIKLLIFVFILVCHFYNSFFSFFLSFLWLSVD